MSRLGHIARSGYSPIGFGPDLLKEGFLGRAGSGILGRSGVTGQLLYAYFFGVPVLIRTP